MSTELRAPALDTVRTVDWAFGVVAGVSAGIVSAIGIRLFATASVLAEAIPTVYGIEGPAPLLGVGLHLLHSLLLGLVYAGLVAGVTDVDTRSHPLTTGAFLGAGYGAALWVTIAVVAVPLAMPALGYASAPAFPYLDPVAFAGYVGFGVFLGVADAALRHATRAPVRVDAGAPGV